jgi:peptidoglycan/LPS O-acetylase OafA/YrhL
MTGVGQVRRLARRIDAATPPQRDRAVDALRALAIAGVIGGHWLVTGLVAGGSPGHTTVSDSSPLASMPWLAPVSWVFQTLAVFFLVGGYASARSYRGGYLPWLRRRLVRLARPVAVLVAVWIPVTIGLVLAGVPGTTIHTLLFLVISPLWFLGVYAGLTALTPPAVWLVRRFGAWAAACPVAMVAVADLVRFGLHGPSWVGWFNLPAGWLVPYLLGMAWALGSLRGRRGPALMLAGGAAATAALIAWAGYPASMVGVNGAHISNLNPPTLAAVTFGIAQCGLALLLRDRLARWMRRPLAWAAVALVNLSAMTLFLWHQTAFITVSSLGLLAGRPAGLLTAPVSGTWVAERLAWLPVFAVVLAGLWATFRRAERGLAGTERQPGRGLDLGQPQVGDQPLAAAGGQRDEHVLEFGDVAGHHGEQVVHLAGHGVRGGDLRHGPDQVVEHVARAHVMTGQGGRHVDLQREAAGVRVEPGADDADHARLLEPADPVQGGGRRQADQPGQLHVGPVRILLQRGQQLDVNIVK